MTEASVSFAGNLTDQPEVRYTQGGIAWAMFRVAVSGRRDQEPSFFTVIVWRDQAEHAAQSLAKGSRVVVVGRLQQRSWTAEDGEPRDSDVVLCLDEFGPLNLQPHPGRQWTHRGGGGPAPRRRRRATYQRPHGVRQLLRLRPEPRPALGTHQAAQAPRRVPGLLPLPALAMPPPGLHRDRARQRQPSPDHQVRPAGSASGPRRTTSSWPTPRPTRATSTGSRGTSPRCAPSPSTAPTTPATPSRPA
jgi:single stranded DNA-binding protein